MIKLLVQYLYEVEYEPRLPDEPLVQDYISTHEWPHYCGAWDSCETFTVCPHHKCGKACHYSCIKLICDECEPPVLPAPHGTATQLLTHVKMYEIADKYDVVGLKKLAREKFRGSCAKFWNNEIFTVAAKHVLLTTVPEDKGLRDIVSAAIFDHKELVQKPKVQALMKEFSDLALGILLKMADEKKKK
jgi:hypothetical protein